jgi:acyl transferase domain-containing protein
MLRLPQGTKIGKIWPFSSHRTNPDTERANCILGDEEEIMSISKVFIEEPKRDTDLYVGSIKGNIGHLEASSGIAGLIKLVLVLRHGHIPPNLNFEKPKPFLKLAERKIKVPLLLLSDFCGQ